MTPLHEITINGTTHVLNHKCGSDAVLDSLRMGYGRESRRLQVQAMKDLENGEYGEIPISISGKLFDEAKRAFATPGLVGFWTLYDFCKTEVGLPYAMAVLIENDTPKGKIAIGIDAARELIANKTMNEKTEIANSIIAASGLLLLKNSSGPTTDQENQPSE